MISEKAFKRFVIFIIALLLLTLLIGYQIGLSECIC
jgi:hypothetical protein